MAAASRTRGASSTQAGEEDALAHMAAGLSIALQCYEDGMGERLASLAEEQSALLVKLDAARQSLPRPQGLGQGRSRERRDGGDQRTDTDDDVAYISHVMSQAPYYLHRVHALSSKKEALANRVAAVEKRSTMLRESLPVPMPEYMAHEMARWRAGLHPFQELGDMAFVVCYRGGVAIRAAPSVDAPCVGEVVEWDEGFWATERLGRLGEDTIYVRLRDGRGWVFESLKGRKVLRRVAPCTMPPPPAPPQVSGEEDREDQPLS